MLVAPLDIVAPLTGTLHPPPPAPCDPLALQLIGWLPAAAFFHVPNIRSFSGRLLFSDQSAVFPVLSCVFYTYEDAPEQQQRPGCHGEEVDVLCGCRPPTGATCSHTLIWSSRLDEMNQPGFPGVVGGKQGGGESRGDGPRVSAWLRLLLPFNPPTSAKTAA